MSVTTPDIPLLPTRASIFVAEFLRRERTPAAAQERAQTLTLQNDKQSIVDQHDQRRYVLCETNTYNARGTVTSSDLEIFRREGYSVMQVMAAADAAGAPVVALPMRPSNDGDVPEIHYTVRIINERLSYRELTALPFEAVCRIARTCTTYNSPHILEDARNATAPADHADSDSSGKDNAKGKKASKLKKKKSKHDEPPDDGAPAKPTFPYFHVGNWRFSGKAATARKLSVAMSRTTKNGLRVWRFYPCYAQFWLWLRLARLGGGHAFECHEGADAGSFYWSQVYSHNSDRRLPIAYECMGSEGEMHLVLSERLETELVDFIVSLWIMRLNNVGFLEELKLCGNKSE